MRATNKGKKVLEDAPAPKLFLDECNALNYTEVEDSQLICMKHEYPL